MIIPIKEHTTADSFILSHQLVIITTGNTRQLTIYHLKQTSDSSNRGIHVKSSDVPNEEFMSKTTSNPFCPHQVIFPIEEYTTTD